MKVKMGMRWNLRRVMADHDMWSTSDLVPLLAERGVQLSREQVYRLVAHTPQRLSMDTLAALCDILACTPNDLIEVEGEPTAIERAVAVTGIPRPEFSADALTEFVRRYELRTGQTAVLASGSGIVHPPAWAAS